MSSRHDRTSFTRSTRTCAVARTAHRVGGVPGPFRLDLPSALPLPVARGHPAQVGRELDVRDPLDGLRLLNVLGPAGETERDGAGAWRHRNTRRHHHPGRAARLPNAAARPPASGGGHRPSPRCPTPPGFPPGGPGVSEAIDRIVDLRAGFGFLHYRDEDDHAVMVWHQARTTADVIAALLDLPASGTRHAPALARTGAHRPVAAIGLWR